MKRATHVNPWRGQMAWIWISGGWIVCISLLHIPASFPSLNAFDPPKRAMWALFLTVLALSGLLQGAFRTRPRAPLAFYGLGGWMILRTFFREVPFREMETGMNWLLPLAAFGIGAECLARADRKRTPPGAVLAAAAAFQGLLMLLQYAGADPLFGDTTSTFAYRPARMIGTVGYQNQAAETLGVLLAGIWLPRMPKWTRWAVLMAGMAVLALTGNRGGFIAYALAVLVVGSTLFTNRGNRKGTDGWKRGLPAALCAALFALAIVLAVPNLRVRMMELGASSNAVQSRLWMHRVAVELWRDAPWTGAGPGEFAYQYLDRLGEVLPPEKDHEVLQQVVFARETHFDLLQFGAEFGWIGLFLLGGLAAACLKRVYRTRHDAPRTCRAWIWVAGFMGTASLFNFSWQTAMAGPLAAFLLGAWLPEPAKANHNQTAPSRLGPFAFGALAVSALAGLMFHARIVELSIRTPALIRKGNLQQLESLSKTCFHRHQSLAGAAYDQVGEPARAERMYQSARKGYRDIPLWSNLANLHTRRNEWGSARDLYQRWADSGIRHEEALNNLSISQENLGRFGEAAQSARERIRLWPPAGLQDLLRISVLLLQAEQAGEVVAFLERHERHWRTFPDVQQAKLWNVMGAALLRTRRIEEARIAFQTALRLDPDLQSARKNSTLLSPEP